MDYLRTRTAIGFRASHELFSNFLSVRVRTEGRTDRQTSKTRNVAQPHNNIQSLQLLKYTQYLKNIPNIIDCFPKLVQQHTISEMGTTTVI